MRAISLLQGSCCWGVKPKEEEKNNIIKSNDNSNNSNGYDITVPSRFEGHEWVTLKELMRRSSGIMINDEDLPYNVVAEHVKSIVTN
jgi:hypothetical protein